MAKPLLRAFVADGENCITWESFDSVIENRLPTSESQTRSYITVLIYPSQPFLLDSLSELVQDLIRKPKQSSHSSITTPATPTKVLNLPRTSHLSYFLPEHFRSFFFHFSLLFALSDYSKPFFLGDFNAKIQPWPGPSVLLVGGRPAIRRQWRLREKPRCCTGTYRFWRLDPFPLADCARRHPCAATYPRVDSHLLEHTLLQYAPMHDVFRAQPLRPEQQQAGERYSYSQCDTRSGKGGGIRFSAVKRPGQETARVAPVSLLVDESLELAIFRHNRGVEGPYAPSFSSIVDREKEVRFKVGRLEG